MPYDKEKAERAYNFISRLTHTKSKWAGVNWTWIPWQEELIKKVYGTVKKNGNRQYKTVYLEIGKKNGKTELGAAVALYQLLADKEQSAEVYSAAGDREQAALVYNVAAQMVRNNPSLSKRLKIVDSRKRIIDFNTNSFYQVLSSEAYTKHGISPSCVLCDETHAYPNRELYDVLTEGTDIARQQQIIFIMTTAGIYDENSIGYELHRYAEQVKEGIIDDPTFLPVMYCADPEKDDWEDEKVWEKVNPSLDYVFDIDNLRTHYKQVKSNPARVPNFQRFRLNMWVNNVTQWMPMDKWNACDDPVDKGRLLKRRCYGGLDLSSTLDLTCFCLVFPPDDINKKWIVLPHFYVPEDTIVKRTKEDNVPYNLWVQAGLITATPGNVVDYDFVKHDIVNASQIYDLRQVGYDPWNSTELAVGLTNDEGIEMVEMRQGAKTLSEPMKSLLKLVMSEKMAHGGHKVLSWNASNTVAKADENENLRPVKDRNQKKRIDGIVSLIMALGRALLNEGDGMSIYESRGVIAL
jgi:phage terminase large subunit-like protein